MAYPACSAHLSQGASEGALEGAMSDNPPPHNPAAFVPDDPALVDSVARSFASALGMEAVRAAIDEQMGRFLPSGSWSLRLLDDAAAAQMNGEGEGGLTIQDGASIPMLWEGQPLAWLEVKLRSRIQSQQVPAGFLRLVADYGALALHNAQTINRIQELAIVDDCTGLYNSRHLNTMLITEIERSRRFHLPFSILFIDLDYFKRINDAHGHQAGSWLLARVAETIRNSIRGIDSAFRYGGDEFVVLLPQTAKEPGLEVGVRLLKTFRVMRYVYFTGAILSARASIGLAAYPEDDQTAPELIHAADQAMYCVKNTTRDNISAAGSGCILEAGE